MTTNETMHLTIIGRKWFDAHYGNTYWSANAYIDGELVLQVPYSYGYGEQYLEETYQELSEMGLVPDRERYASGARPDVRRFCREHNIKLVHEAAHVESKDDLYRREEEE